MKEFCLLGHKIIFSTEQINYYQLMMKYQEMAEAAREELGQQYSRLGNLRNVVGQLEEYAVCIYGTALQNSLEYIQQQDIYTIDLERLADRCEEYFLEHFTEPFETLCSQYEEIVGEKEEAAQYRRMRKASRAKYRGFGYGIGGAISSSMRAGALNMATGMGHSLVNALGNAGSSAVSAARQSALYKDNTKKEQLQNGIFTAVNLISLEVMEILSDEAGIQYEYLTDEGEAEAKALSNNILRGDIPEDKLCDAIVRSLSLEPQNPRLMQYAIEQYGDPDGSIEQMGHFFGYDLSWVKRELVEKLFGGLEKKNYRTEEELWEEKERVIQTCADYGVDNSCYLSILDIKWQELDRELRTVEGVEYETRETARNIESDFATFRKKFAGIQWEERNLLEESCKLAYEEEMKNGNYLEKRFVEQIPERLEKLWEPYQYRQRLVWRLSAPDTFLEELPDLLSEQPFYEELKKRLHFHEFAGDKKNKAPALKEEDGAGLLFIDQTLLGGGKKGTVVTTRKLIEYEKSRSSYINLEEVTQIQNGKGGLSVLDIQGKDRLTLGFPVYLLDKNKESYAAFFNAMIAGILKAGGLELEKCIFGIGETEKTEVEEARETENGESELREAETREMETGEAETEEVKGRGTNAAECKKTIKISEPVQTPEPIELSKVIKAPVSEKRAGTEKLLQPEENTREGVEEAEKKQIPENFIGQSLSETLVDHSSKTESEKKEKEVEESTQVEKEDFWNCPNCGNLMKKGKKFCNQCGTALAGNKKNNAAEEQIVRYCSFCGNKLKSGKRFCSQCGRKIIEGGKEDE